jgi:hypothetical protein
VEDAGAEIQVGVTSSGDAVCRATSIIARTDTAKAQAFLACARDGATLEAVLACGCTAVNAKGEC